MASRDDIIKFCFHLGLSHTDILYTLSLRHGIVLSRRHLGRILKSNGLLRRANYTEIENVVTFLRQQLIGSGSLHGYRWMHQKCIENGINVRKEDVRELLRILDPRAVEERRSRRLHRRQYRAKGPNYIWHIDSYDKLKPFGICINGCIDGFSRKLIWLKAYNTSSDPRLIGGYFLDAVNELGGCPVIVRADRGTENGIVCSLQRLFRRQSMDSFAGDKSFLYGKSTANQRIERWWGFLRKECVEFWLELFHKLKDDGEFDGYFIDKNLIIFCFLGLIQGDLDSTADVWHSHRIRPANNENVPHGRPNVMFTLPELFNTDSCLVGVPDSERRACRDQCVFRSSIPCDQDVFKLCSNLMARHNLNIPCDAYQAVDLYLELRRLISNILS